MKARAILLAITVALVVFAAAIMLSGCDVLKNLKAISTLG